MKEAGGYLTGAAITLSILIHGVTLAGVEGVIPFPGGPHGLSAKARMARQKQSAEPPIQFQFIEAPNRVLPEKPKPNPRVAARDSVSSDASAEKDPSSLNPSAKAGLADQLAQRRGMPAVPSAPPSRPQQAKPNSQGDQGAQKRLEKAQEAVPDGIGKQPGPPSKGQEARPQQTPKTQVKGLTGSDKISTDEMAKLKAKARFTGITSFEATGSGMGEYMQNLKEKIWLAWYPYLSFKYPSDFKTADAILSLTINKNGNLQVVKLVENSGSPLFATFCVESVQRAAPFKPLPEEILPLLGKDEIELLFAFHYR